MKTGVELIAEERNRQVEKEGWSLDHDALHDNQELAWAAVCYAAPYPVIASQMIKKGKWGCNCRGIVDCSCASYNKHFKNVEDPWPWSSKWDKREKHDRKRKLIIAGALIAAEIDRIN